MSCLELKLTVTVEVIVVGERPMKEEFCPPPYTHYEMPPSFYRSAMILKPQLGLGAVSRLPSAKSRILIASQRSSTGCIHPQGPLSSDPTIFHPDSTGKHFHCLKFTESR
ncbi:hypothetical protein JD844_033159 [Phrynosoma platyrhinos]|uniref:Uncharacterized protein n=1 Tax=Phrynosoma platyrhinos TaxID=52577 RepID=A0ABQ7T5X4_PHRPL|nr:hypothetical protein JD844_033159 [Phrynosoma platyrhinos]